MNHKYWPFIRSRLKESNYNYNPKEIPEIDFKLAPTLTRSLWFMLFDENKAFFRGHLNCSIDSWLIESEFFLGLLQNNNPEIVFEILGNSRFRGNPPKLNIYKDHVDYYQITFHVGSGLGWGLSEDSKIYERLSEAIDINTQMYEFSKEGYISEERIGDFLTLVNKVYEAY